MVDRSRKCSFFVIIRLFVALICLGLFPLRGWNLRLQGSACRHHPYYRWAVIKTISVFILSLICFCIFHHVFIATLPQSRREGDAWFEVVTAVMWLLVSNASSQKMPPFCFFVVFQFQFRQKFQFTWHLSLFRNLPTNALLLRGEPRSAAHPVCPGSSQAPQEARPVSGRHSEPWQQPCSSRSQISVR